jgi:hypothetical protein
MLTCDQVCAQIGETCVANGCASGETTAHGDPDFCAGGSFLGGFTNQACDAIIPNPFSGAKITCCCTLS